MNIAFFGSSLVSAYWNGAATYYRGIIRALSERGHRVVFYEPDAFDRQAHRDIPDPNWAKVVVYPPTLAGVQGALRDARDSELVVKASGVGVFDELLEREVAALRGRGLRTAFWDVDAPATLDRLAGHPADPFRQVIGEYDLVLTYGGGPPVTRRYESFGARRCIAIYNAVDPREHAPVAAEPRFRCDLALMANRLPDRETRIREFFFTPAGLLPERTFLIGGSGWENEARGNVRAVGHVFTRDHNAFNCSALAALNVSRDSMARNGYSPATRVFEAAGAGACIITDAWEGVDRFLEPGREWLVAESGEEVASILEALTPERARTIGERARRRVLAEHTYRQRAELLESVLVEEATA